MHDHRYHDRHQEYRPWWLTPPRPRPDTSRLRISNAERQVVTDALCRHLADGRLDESEFEERATQAAAAKTQADLDPLLADLPPLGAVVPLAPSRSRHGLGWFAAVLLLAVLAWSVVGAVVRPFHVLFVPWPLLLVAVFLLVRRGRHRHHDYERGRY